MDEFDLIRWLEALTEAGLIHRWQTLLWSGGVPVSYVIDGRLYRDDDAERLVRHFEKGYPPSRRNTPLRVLLRQRIGR